ncbi:class I SAM-dependent methyltransferase [Desulfosediminicola sp.]|uniref:class I SAM-dependent methyltransferase n=1 Tax=Desulfosediminicola sp. TaxID=2886825 RepID=UPI003AF24D08
MDLKEESILKNEIIGHWYYKSKAAALLRLVGDGEYRVILDVGAGSGFFTKYLLGNTSVEQGICVDISYPAERDENVGGKKNQYLKSCGSVGADLVLLMDVLEHIDNDLELLRQYFAMVPTGTRFFVSVPAFNFLWSKHDEFLEHRRRYTLNSLQRIVRLAGLRQKTICYYFGFVFLIVATVRLAQKLFLRGNHSALKSDLQSHCLVVNALLTTMCSLELRVFRFNKLAGVSIFCLCEKESKQ